MARWFYTDPLAAAWMARYFGMEFGTDRNKLSRPEEFTDTYSNEYGTFPINSDEKHFVHPDSLHLLEPQSGDVLLNADDRPATVIPNRDKGSDCNCVRLGAAVAFVADGSALVIQRNGIPFMWPEQEAV